VGLAQWVAWQALEAAPEDMGFGSVLIEILHNSSVLAALRAFHKAPVGASQARACLDAGLKPGTLQCRLPEEGEGRRGTGLPLWNSALRWRHVRTFARDRQLPLWKFVHYFVTITTEQTVIGLQALVVIFLHSSSNAWADSIFRMNVAMSRAVAAMVVIGPRPVTSELSMWAYRAVEALGLVIPTEIPGNRDGGEGAARPVLNQCRAPPTR